MPVSSSQSPYGAAASARGPFPLPLVGRDAELAALGTWLDDAASGRGGTTLVAGVGGVGKTRLVAAVAERAARQGWMVSVGRAYPVETGVPYAAFADALTGVLRGLTPASLAVLTRGDGGTLANISPAFATGSQAATARDSGGDVKARLHWSFAQFLGQLAAQKPLLFVLENLQWADSSSLELLHFVARQIGSERVALLCTYNETELEANPTLRATEQSLLSLGASRLTRLEPLGAEALFELVREAFRADAASARALSGRLWNARATFAPFNVAVSGDCEHSTNLLFVAVRVPVAVATGAYYKMNGLGQYTLSCANAPSATGIQDYVLDANEVAGVNAQLAAMNQVIRQEAQQRGFAYFPLGALYEDVVVKAPFNAITLMTSNQPYGPYVSLDGIHPTAAGQTVLAQAAARALNETYGFGIPVSSGASLLASR